MTDSTGIRITRKSLSVPVRRDGRPVRPLVVITPTYQYFKMFCLYSAINPRCRDVIWAGASQLRGLGYDDWDVVLYETSESWLPDDLRYWLSMWCQLSKDGMLYSKGEAAMLTPDIRDMP